MMPRKHKKVDNPKHVTFNHVILVKDTYSTTEYIRGENPLVRLQAFIEEQRQRLSGEWKQGQIRESKEYE